MIVLTNRSPDAISPVRAIPIERHPSDDSQCQQQPVRKVPIPALQDRYYQTISQIQTKRSVPYRYVEPDGRISDFPLPA